MKTCKSIVYDLSSDFAKLDRELEELKFILSNSPVFNIKPFRERQLTNEVIENIYVIADKKVELIEYPEGCVPIINEILVRTKVVIGNTLRILEIYDTYSIRGYDKLAVIALVKSVDSIYKTNNTIINKLPEGVVTMNVKELERYEKDIEQQIHKFLGE